MWAVIDENMSTIYKSQMEREEMFRSFFCLAATLLAVSVNANAMSHNEVAMYNMLNDSPGYDEDPTDIKHQRYWQRMKKLQWLANPRNLLKPGLDEHYEEDYTS